MSFALEKFIPAANAATVTPLGQQQHKSTAAQVELEFTSSPAGPSYLSKQIARYPYHIGRLLKNSGTPQPMAMLFLQCTSGGIFERDSIDINITAHPKAIASVRHAAATVVHSMQPGQTAHTRLNLIAAEGSYVEYTGNLNIMFPRSHLNSQVDVMLHPNAIALISDAYLAHDPEEQSVHFDQLETTLNVYNHQHSLLARDRCVLGGTAFAEQLQAAGSHFTTHASIYVLAANCASAGNTALLTLIRDAITSTSLTKRDAYIGSGNLPNACGVFVRLMASSGQPLQMLIAAISARLRNACLNQGTPGQ